MLNFGFLPARYSQLIEAGHVFPVQQPYAAVRADDPDIVMSGANVVSIPNRGTLGGNWVASGTDPITLVNINGRQALRIRDAVLRHDGSAADFSQMSTDAGVASLFEVFLTPTGGGFPAIFGTSDFRQPAASRSGHFGYTGNFSGQIRLIQIWCNNGTVIKTLTSDTGAAPRDVPHYAATIKNGANIATYFDGAPAQPPTTISGLPGTPNHALSCLAAAPGTEYYFAERLLYLPAFDTGQRQETEAYIESRWF